MYQEIFEGLGLSPNEAKMYESLVERGESTISEIAVAAKIHRRNAYDAIERLIEKGLCFQIFSHTENRYNAVDPDKLLELFAEREQKLKEVLPDLKRKFSERFAPQEAYIYRGHEGQKNIFRDVIRVGQDSFFIGAKGGWYDPRIDASRKAFFKEANRKNIKFIQLFDFDLKQARPKFFSEFEGKLQYRFLPPGYSTTSAIHIFGDYVVTYTGLSIMKLPDDVVYFVIHSKNLAESYRTWFWYMWGQSKAEKKKGT
ncbi:MAG TPA: hypothetical protein DIS62_03140 [Candidatus Kerfeldbacteria bacterium]|nr:MAG: Transcriptional regulator, TrmB [Parcubacteria group bacterium GW2011_GWA2_48_9]KKW15951.1 MAG: Transcriptional regulator, TrmB [Parcubacteria group bacterium GW2011_GWC2_49_9]HCJ52941.1 hypothetical protein [Candidatus Kerfeldbacteria bacterium]HCM67971.1 hypothetical protein [Candidatus Kerfeldbacteria bacterium]